jgi:hypothetical protein
VQVSACGITQVGRPASEVAILYLALERRWRGFWRRRRRPTICLPANAGGATQPATPPIEHAVIQE